MAKIKEPLKNLHIGRSIFYFNDKSSSLPWNFTIYIIVYDILLVHLGVSLLVMTYVCLFNLKQRVLFTSLYKNITNDLALLTVLVAQWIECPPGVGKIVGLNPVMGSEIFLSIIGLKKRHCVAVVIYLFISNHCPNLSLFTNGVLIKFEQPKEFVFLDCISTLIS